MLHPQEHSQNFHLSQIACSFVLGIVFVILCQYIAPLRHCPSNPLASPLIGLRKKANRARKLDSFEQNDHYGLEHRLLNLKTDPESMWLNVGFWKNNPASFQEACQQLLQEVISDAEIEKTPTSFSIMEVGCGCAETACFMRRALPKKFRNYIGITLNGCQAQYATRKIQGLESGSYLSRVFKADAANPEKWSHSLRDTIEQVLQQPNESQNGEIIGDQIWLLAIDTLYHFRPSRQPILSFACQKLGASIMATDIVLASSLPTWKRVVLRMLFYFLDVPWGNVLTKEKYMKMLITCGYEENDIHIRDITEHSFPGYYSFLKTQSKKWELIGGSPEVFRPMVILGKIVAWWAKSGTIRQYIIVAKKPSKAT